MKNLWRLFFGEHYSIKRASALLAITALLSNALGLARNIVFNRLIPQGQLDIYQASFQIPDLIFNVLILGAISSAFVPVLSELLQKNPENEKAWKKLTDQVFTWLTVTFAVIAIVLCVAMEPIMKVVVHGFDAERLAMSVTLSRIFLVQGVFLAWSFCFGGLLNSFNRFSTYALAPLLYNIVLITGGFIAAHAGIIAMGYAVVVGALIHCGVQFLEVRKLKYFPRFDLQASPKLKEIFRLMLPRSLNLGVGQLVTIVYVSLASALTVGSINIFRNMNDLQTTPTVIIANSIAVAFFPTLTKYIAANDWDSLNKLLLKALRTALFLLIPCLVMGIVLRAQIVRLYFGIGGANWDLTTMAIQTFVMFMIGIIPASLVALLARVFYGLKDTRTPLILSGIAGLTGILVAWLGINVFHQNVAVLALATTMVSLVQCILYLSVLYRHKHVQIPTRPIMVHTAIYSFGAALAGVSTWVVLNFIHFIYETTGILSTRYILGLFFQMLIAGIIGVAVYYLYSRILDREELAWLKKSAFSKG